MNKAKFLRDAKLDPARFYRNPTDIIRDRRLNDEDRKQIIEAWEREALGDEGFAQALSQTDAERREQLRRARAMLEREIEPGNGEHA
jgi:hypothetical protein